jgi:hypothetical protein
MALIKDSFNMTLFKFILFETSAILHRIKEIK